jgi:hypothetical protein
MMRVVMQPLLSHEVVGTRVGHMPTHELVDIWTAALSGIVKYGFAIEYRDLEPPRTGIFDGLRIVIDPDVGFEMQCFLLLHLFGHSVQWVRPVDRAQARGAAAHAKTSAVHAGAARLRDRGGGSRCSCCTSAASRDQDRGSAISSTRTGATSSATTRSTNCRRGRSASSAGGR